MRKLARLAICATILATSTTLAAKSSQKSKSVKKAPTSTKSDKYKKDWSLSASATVNSNLYKFSSTNHSASTDLSLGWSTKLANKFSLSTGLSGNKGLTGTREFKLLSSSISLKRPIHKFKYISLSGSTSFVMPTSEYARKYQQLIFGVRASVSMVMPMGKLGAPGLTLINVPGIGINSHEYKRAINGSSNTAYSISDAFVISYGATDWMSLKAVSQYAKSFTYDGNTKDSYFFSQSASFPIESTVVNGLGVEIGHAYGGTPLAPNGHDTQIKLFDERASSVFIGIGASI
jgi:hypothetical protein